jgi:signal transduction histidine kinase
VDDVLAEPLYRQVDESLSIRSALALPLEMGRDLLGVLDMESEKVAAFKEDDVPFLQLLADQVAVALNNASLFSQVTRFNQDLEQVVQQRTHDLQKTFEQLERLDRAKSDFISISSHELRTPVTLLKGYSQMLMEDPGVKGNPNYVAMIAGIQSGANRLHDVIESMLDVAKIDNRELQLHLTPLFIPVLIRFVCDGLKGAFEERHITLVEEYPELPKIQGDLEGLRKVFYQLIINAIKYTPDGGKITITGRPLKPGELGMPRGGVEVIVRDTGIGIDPGMRELIFVKFYQTGEVSLHSTGKTKFKGGGPGLGLAIAKGIVAAHSGLIWAESPGYDEKRCPGSHFHVALPVEPVRPA